MKAVADTGPLIAAANRRDQAHRLAAQLVTLLGRELLVPDLVLVEVDQLLRSRVSGQAARAFLEAVSRGEHSVAFLSARLLRRAAQIDEQYAELELGVVDTAIMAVAEERSLPLLTFDFAHFRATRPATGHWKLIVDENRYLRETTA